MVSHAPVCISHGFTPVCVGKLFYAQCDASELDLFDGFDAAGNYTSIGIGEKQAPQYASPLR